MDVRDNDVADPTQVVIAGRPRRLHGSRRAGPDPAFPEPERTFNLRPSLDELPEEQALTIEINGRPVASLLCSPTGSTELAVGWAFGQGFFDDRSQLQRVTPYRDRVSLMIDRPGWGGDTWRRVVTAGFDASSILTRRPSAAIAAVDNPGDSAGDTDVRHHRSRFLAMVERVFARFENERSGSFHHAAISDGVQICAVAHDVTRHNALDKLVGWSVAQGIDRSRLILCLTGRISADTAHKAVRAGFPIVVSDSLPTSEAVELAHAARVTLVGRALDDRRAIYAHPWRLSSDDDS
jgi:FdhD protein